MEVILAALPLIIIFFLILVLKWSILKTMTIALLILLAIVIFFWKMPYDWILAASFKGFLLSLEISLIVLGAIFFLNVIKTKGLEEKIKETVEVITFDRRIQIVIIGFAFTALIEGSAGFGVTVILAATLLVSLGFSIISAVTLSLIGGAIHVVFGAVGTPIVFGFGAGLTSPEILNYLQVQGITLESFLHQTGALASTLNLIIGFFASLIMTIMLVLFFGEKQEVKKLKYILEIIPFLILSSFLITGPAWFLANYFGPELPSLIGGLFGLFILLIIVQKSWFLPKTQWDFNKITEKNKKIQSISFFKIFKILIPYFVLILILFISRANFLPIENWLMNFLKFSLPQILGSNISYFFSPFYSLGILLLLSGGLFVLIFKLSLNQAKVIFQDALTKIKTPLLVLIICLIFVQIFIYSGENLSNLQSLSMILVEAMVKAGGIFWPIFAPFVGAIGAFIAGSVTVSNLWFGNFQANTALLLNIDPRLFLSLQAIGASLGNMLSIHNVVIALAALGAINKVNMVIKYNILPVIILCFLLGIIGFFLNLF